VRIVHLNLAVDPALDQPDALLARYHTVTEWSRALTAEGAAVHVVQRFSRDAIIRREGVIYEFVGDGTPGVPLPWRTFLRVVAATHRADPDVVHVNGLMFPGMTRALRAALGPARRIVLQDHSGAVPGRRVWPFAAMRAARWARAFRHADGVSFTAPELAARWHHVGLPTSLPVLTIAEASTAIEPLDYVQARKGTGISGEPAILWVGRLNANKDPNTVLRAMERVVRRLPTARLWMIVPPEKVRQERQRGIRPAALLTPYVTMIGSVGRENMAAYYSSADIFVSGSRHEGSGYALIESLACGALPCVTDIPAFRALTHGGGELWRAGDVDACAAALLKAAHRVTPAERRAVKMMFAQHLSWDVVARQTLAAYRRLMVSTRTER
jgi:glycosyltransferase involved in cell wall biosynthesis